MLLGSASLDELLDRITTELKRLVPYDVLTVYQVDDVHGHAGAAALGRPVRRRDPGRAARAWDTGLTGWVVDHRLAQNVPSAHRRPAHPAGARHRETSRRRSRSCR